MKHAHPLISRHLHADNLNLTLALLNRLLFLLHGRMKAPIVEIHQRL